MQEVNEDYDFCPVEPIVSAKNLIKYKIIHLTDVFLLLLILFAISILLTISAIQTSYFHLFSFILSSIVVNILYILKEKSSKNISNYKLFLKFLKLQTIFYSLIFTTFMIRRYFILEINDLYLKKISFYIFLGLIFLSFILFSFVKTYLGIYFFYSFALPLYFFMTTLFNIYSFSNLIIPLIVTIIIFIISIFKTYLQSLWVYKKIKDWKMFEEIALVGLCTAILLAVIQDWLFFEYFNYNLMNNGNFTDIGNFIFKKEYFN
ncbi:hypothetical protein TUBRATIS_006840 [Tubulinosema ratisbonensis]|uniref:Uncharacterized protein n=1 Tax=Tubulinosema ratisbonensis TaxID=291195 RepID=A0A437ANP3_9MICR|nr:hypothetical protein TUBRATIS_006840 [Tubulinosema ratisbonensis]